jgi:hypothetical protein
VWLELIVRDAAITCRVVSPRSLRDLARAQRG